MFSKDNLDNPSIDFKKFYTVRQNLLADVYIRKGTVNVGDYIKVGSNLLKISNILVDMHTVPITVSKENATLVFKTKLPVSIVTNQKKIKFISKEQAIDKIATKISESISPEKASKLVTKILLDDEEAISKYRKTGLANIKAIPPKLYQPIIKMYYKYQLQLKYFSECFKIDDGKQRKVCAQGVKRQAIQSVLNQKQFCMQLKNEDNKKLCIQAIDDLVNKYK